MADSTAVINAWLLQVHFAMHRAGAVRLTRAPRATMGKEHVKLFEGSPDELRSFDDAAAAEAFVRTSIAEGDVCVIAWSKDEHHVLGQLKRLGHLLAATPIIDALIIGPSCVARTQFRADRLKHAGETMGMATLLGLHVILEQEVAP